MSSETWTRFRKSAARRAGFIRSMNCAGNSPRLPIAAQDAGIRSRGAGYSCQSVWARTSRSSRWSILSCSPAAVPEARPPRYHLQQLPQSRRRSRRFFVDQLLRTPRPDSGVQRASDLPLRHGGRGEGGFDTERESSRGSLRIFSPHWEPVPRIGRGFTEQETSPQTDKVVNSHGCLLAAAFQCRSPRDR